MPLLAHVRAFPHVTGVVSPYSTPGALQVSSNSKTAFATVNYNEPANKLPNATRSLSLPPSPLSTCRASRSPRVVR